MHCTVYYKEIELYSSQNLHTIETDFLFFHLSITENFLSGGKGIVFLQTLNPVELCTSLAHCDISNTEKNIVKVVVFWLLTEIRIGKSKKKLMLKFLEPFTEFFWDLKILI